MYTKPRERRRALALMRKNPVMSDREIARKIGGVSNKTVSRWRTAEAVPRDLLPGAIKTEEVIATAATVGVQLTPRKLLRWHKLGLLPPWSAFRLYPGRGSATYWAPLVIEQAVEIDRLLRRHRTARDAVVGLVASGYEVDDTTARRAHRDFVRAVRDRDVLVPRVGTSKRALARLRRRSLRGSRLWLDLTIAERGILGISESARRTQLAEAPDRISRRDVLNDQIGATVRVLRGDLFRWAGRQDFVNAVDEPPRQVLDELHRRLTSQELRRVIGETDRAGLQDVATTVGAGLLQFADEVLRRAEAEGSSMFGDLEQTRLWHSLYREIVLADPVIPARFSPFFLTIVESEVLEPALGSIFVAVAMRFPDWRAMTLALYTWPQSAWDDWRLAL